MKKNMYSLMLAEDVIRAIDELAAEQGTNRSNLINQILAEHVSLVTPEKHVGRVFDMICSLMDGRGNYRTYAEPNNLTMSIKSVLKYHYRPTIRYEVEMARSSDEATGQIKINFRTTSSELMMELTKFFKLGERLSDPLFRVRARIRGGAGAFPSYFQDVRRRSVHGRRTQRRHSGIRRGVRRNTEKIPCGRIRLRRGNRKRISEVSQQRSQADITYKRR